MSIRITKHIFLENLKNIKISKFKYYKYFRARDNNS